MRIVKLTPLLFLAACMGGGEPAPVIEAPIQTPEPAPQVAAVETAPVVEEAPALPKPEPDRLAGLNPKQVQALMGEPSLVRRDNNVQVMLFETSACVFEIVFYEPDPDSHFHADRMNARTRSGTDMDLQTCLVDVLPGGQWLDGTGG